MRLIDSLISTPQNMVQIDGAKKYLLLAKSTACIINVYLYK